MTGKGAYLITNKLIDGDYRKENGRLSEIDLISEVLQNVFVTLSVERGKFYPNKNFGSSISNITNEPMEQYALAFARQALDDTDGVYVLDAVIKSGTAELTVLINDKREKVNIKLENNV